jgi:hypothetical protein
VSLLIKRILNTTDPYTTQATNSPTYTDQRPRSQKNPHTSYTNHEKNPITKPRLRNVIRQNTGIQTTLDLLKKEEIERLKPD